jgi:hypothetical protein
MNTPSSSVSTSTSVPPKVVKTNNEKLNNMVTINEKVNLTKKQNEVLHMICNSYEMTISEYMQQALVEAMKFDIEEGNFSDVLLGKIDEGNKKKDDGSSTQSSIMNDVDIFKKL